MSLDARLRHPSCTREQAMPAYGYARISHGRGDGTDRLQNQRMRLTGAGVDAVHIHEDIIMGYRDAETGPEWSAGGYPARRYPAADRARPAGTRHAGSPQMIRAWICGCWTCRPCPGGGGEVAHGCGGGWSEGRLKGTPAGSA